ncbi:MAG: hypothetical protein N2167_02020 [Flavobacteriales bacterium]|nr:hypothetical protein [Flavobacteriales bacterium]
MNQTTTQSYLSTLRFISLAMAGGVFFFTATMVILKIGQLQMLEKYTIFYRYIPYFFSFISIPISTFLFKNTIGKRTGNSLKQKLIAYRSAHILRTALIEAPGLIAGVMFFISGDWIALIPAPIALLFILLNIPNSNRIIQELALEEQESRLLHTPDSILY